MYLTNEISWPHYLSSHEVILINQQQFTKTSNIWGVDNMAGGTNTNRIVLFCKDPDGMPSMLS